MPRRTAFALLLLILLGPPAAAGERVSGEAVAIDGDSLCVGERTRGRCRGVVIRLAGADAFEGRQTCAWADGGRWPCGERARQALAQILARGPVHCDGVGRSYGRLVAICRDAEGGDVAAQLVRDGWAVDLPRYRPDYAALEAEARRRKAGAWAGGMIRPENWRRRGG